MVKKKARSERLKEELIELIGKEEFDRLPKYEKMSSDEIEKKARTHEKFMYNLAETSPRFYTPEETKKDIIKLNYMLALSDEKEMMGRTEPVRISMPMLEKEVKEAQISGVPEPIIYKMVQGLELSDQEKKIVRSKGKVYVLSYTKERGRTTIKPQLRNLPKKKGR